MSTTGAAISILDSGNKLSSRIRQKPDLNVEAIEEIPVIEQQVSETCSISNSQPASSVPQTNTAMGKLDNVQVKIVSKRSSLLTGKNST